MIPFFILDVVDYFWLAKTSNNLFETNQPNVQAGA